MHSNSFCIHACMHTCMHACMLLAPAYMHACYTSFYACMHACSLFSHACMLYKHACICMFILHVCMGALPPLLSCMTTKVHASPVSALPCLQACTLCSPPDSPTVQHACDGCERSSFHPFPLSIFHPLKGSICWQLHPLFT